MMQRNRSLLLLTIQILLVLSIAGKYLYERKTCTRVWARTAQIDPNMPLRGRYLALRLTVDACGLTKPEVKGGRLYGPRNPGELYWTVKIAAKDGKLVAVPAPPNTRPEETTNLQMITGRACERTPLWQPVDYFIDDRAKPPFPLQNGEELWVEVTVPPSGPPRPIQLAVSSLNGFKVLGLR